MEQIKQQIKEFIIFVLLGIAFYYVNIRLIDKDWHLLSGWITCTLYYSFFDLKKIVDNLNDL